MNPQPFGAASALALRTRHWIASVAILLSCTAWGGTHRTTAPDDPSRRLALIVNDVDAYSVAVGEHYAKRRGIPPQNVIHVRIDGASSTLSAAQFAKIQAQVSARLPTSVQMIALAWVQPYRVECMSITTAFAMGGFDRAYCAEPCKLTKTSAYFGAHTRVPANSLGIYPTMSIAAATIAEGKALVDRGIAADGSLPVGTAYLVSSNDAARNARARNYAAAARLASAPLKLSLAHIDTMHRRSDVMTYFVGVRQVDDMTSNRFLPGAVADHLTSTGGDLLHTRQMSSLQWIKAGATGSYGSVVEPCAFVEKFPDPATFLRFYLAGETLIEAYWKSVAMPGQGIFIGEPLARPFARLSTESHP